MTCFVGQQNGILLASHLRMSQPHFRIHIYTQIRELKHCIRNTVQSDCVIKEVFVLDIEFKSLKTGNVCK